MDGSLRFRSDGFPGQCSGTPVPSGPMNSGRLVFFTSSIHVGSRQGHFGIVRSDRGGTFYNWTSPFPQPLSPVGCNSKVDQGYYEGGETNTQDICVFAHAPYFGQEEALAIGSNGQFAYQPPMSNLARTQVVELLGPDSEDCPDYQTRTAPLITDTYTMIMQISRSQTAMWAGAPLEDDPYKYFANRFDQLPPIRPAARRGVPPPLTSYSQAVMGQDGSVFVSAAALEIKAWLSPALNGNSQPTWTYPYSAEATPFTGVRLTPDETRLYFQYGRGGIFGCLHVANGTTCHDDFRTAGGVFVWADFEIGENGLMYIGDIAGNLWAYKLFGEPGSSAPISKETENPTATPSYEPATIFPTIVETTAPVVTDAPSVLPSFSLVVQFLVDKVGVDPISFEDETSAQSGAVLFLLSLGVPIPSTVTDEGATDFIQVFVLATLYLATKGLDPGFWSFKYKFLSGSDVCLWNLEVPYSDGSIRPEGVFCDDENEVTDIIIPINRVDGSLPEEMGLLTRITLLDMRINDLQGSIPEKLSELTNLTYWDFGNNDLSGPIPEGIGAMTALTELGLNENLLSGPLPASFRELSLMQLLKLDDNLLSGGITSLYAMTSLRGCYIEDNQFVETIEFDFFANSNSLLQLDLSDNLLGGQIPSHLFDLPSLEVLDMHGNNFVGPLPFISENTQLSFLALHENQMTGAIPDSIVNLSGLRHLDLTTNRFRFMPRTWSGLSELQYLFLTNNPFVPSTIPDSIQSLTDMVDLSLKKTNLIGPIPTWLPALTRLVLLDLHFNSLIGTIPAELGNMESLRVLLVQQNQLVGEVPTSFTNISTIDYLDFENNTLSGDLQPLCDTFPASFFDTFIMIADCEEPDSGGAPEIRCVCCQLCCSDTGPPCNDLDKFAQIDPLRETGYQRVSYDLTVDFNITDPMDPSDTPSPAPSVPPTWQPTIAPGLLPTQVPSTTVPTQEPSSQPLSLPTEVPATIKPSSQPSIAPSFDIVVQFLVEKVGVNPAAFGDENSAQSIAVGFLLSLGAPIPAEVTDEGATTFIQAFVMATFYLATDGPGGWVFRYRFLSGLDVCSWNLLVPYSDGTLRPEGVFCNDNLEVTRIVIPLNDVAGQLPDEMGLLTKLSILNMPINNINGTIPEAFSTLTDLLSIGLENNDLTGTIPDGIGDMTSLTTLGLSGNLVQGPLPPTMNQLSNMRIIGLDDNFLTGEISSLYSMTNLQACYIEDNSFTQTLDDAFFADSLSMVQLDISDNLLDGQIPNHLFNLPNLNILDLHGNVLYGTIPEVPFNTRLEFLALHDNVLIGSIPGSLANIVLLQHLDLSNNRFTGMLPMLPSIPGLFFALRYLFLANNPALLPAPIPDFLLTLTSLVDVSFKGTNRVGTIPTGLPLALTNLVLLDLHDNRLTGTIPSEIGTVMTRLRFLQLQQNQLTGTVPSTLTSLSTIDHLDFENNSLTGSLQFLCDKFPSSFFDTFVMIADCATTTSDDDDDDAVAIIPEIDCSCCELCCYDASPEPCNDEDKLAQVDPIWEASYQRVSYSPLP